MTFIIIIFGFFTSVLRDPRGCARELVTMDATSDNRILINDRS